MQRVRNDIYGEQEWDAMRDRTQLMYRPDQTLVSLVLHEWTHLFKAFSSLNYLLIPVK